ncbi:hypothetical protein D1814_02245 [Alteromonas sp. BL110]|uniref:hypothetical protein n=1 Tax=Alteromonas sp. BL110 TaxID=1714845 RepID=UPI000E4C634D|nr:hypothetical protein [Alteromonas sp. BL110]AXT37572.1 hypothetical protein D1814_02245 [Alteromonas sp. BL110]RKM81063.1 hypothetical protein D7031_15590 [Alteromonas sp. BL110]
MDEIFFETKIKQDGTKLFAFSIPLMKQRESAKGGGGRGGRGEGGGRGGRGGPENRGGSSQKSSDSSDRMTEQLYASLDDKLEETGYCQTGYIEIDTHQTEDRLHLLGECNETASELDRLDFPNVN